MLVTGGSGYFGSLLARQLVARGDTVRVFDLNPTDDPEVELVQGDIRDVAAVEAACRGVDVVYHNVAQVPLARDHALFDSVNRTGTLTMLEAARRQGVGKVVSTSSSAIYGVPRVNPVTELTPPSPGESYGAAKLAGEQLCREYAANGLDVSIVRPRTILGFGRLGIFQILFEWIREGSNVPVLGAGDNVYQFVHADDLAAACILAGNRPGVRSGVDDFNCGAAEFGSMRSVLEHLCAHAGTGSKVRSVPMRAAVAGMNATSAIGVSPLGAYHALMYGRSMYFDITKAQTLLGWQPEYSNEQMFVDSYEWYLAHRDQVLAARGQSAHRSAVKQGILSAVKRLL
ncbi:MAG TPA: NAD-dependent epimerase/dehydratase family protein [Ilumatobacter sp.]|nr:NAD-dependent epimerase/dehydratase family protein [Ilumatobacter sp.]